MKSARESATEGQGVSVSYEIDSKLGILRIQVEGSSGPREQGELASQWAKDPRYRTGMPILLDNRRRSELSSTPQIGKMAALTERSELFPVPTRCAVLVAGDAQFGMTRMFAMRSAETNLETRAFRDEAEAERWLTEP
jgi:hypothetical protein